MRALNAGWSNVVDDATIVFHRRSASFGRREGRSSCWRGPATPRRTAPRVHAADPRVRELRVPRQGPADGRQAVRAGRRPFPPGRDPGSSTSTTAARAARRDERRPHVGAPGRYEPYLLTSDTKVLELSRVRGRRARAPRAMGAPRAAAARAVHPTRQYRAVVADILSAARHRPRPRPGSAGAQFDLPSVARALDIPVSCRSTTTSSCARPFHLLDEADRSAAGCARPATATAASRRDWVSGSPAT